MAASSEIRQGSIYSVQTNKGLVIEGVVKLVYEKARILIIETANHDKKDITFVNLDQITNIEFKQAGNEMPVAMENIDEEAIKEKEKKNIERRREESKRVGRGVSPLAQKVFDHLFKRLPGHMNLNWDHTNILFLNNSFKISDPYRKVECVTGENKRLSFVQDQLNDFWNKYSQQVDLRNETNI